MTDYPYSVKIDSSTIKQGGKGLFATKDFKREEILTPYYGRVTTPDEIDKLTNEEAERVLNIQSIQGKSIVVGTDARAGAQWMNDAAMITLDQISMDSEEDSRLITSLPWFLLDMHTNAILHPFPRQRELSFRMKWLIARVFIYLIPSLQKCNALPQLTQNLRFVATQDIVSGSELFFHYGVSYWFRSIERQYQEQNKSEEDDGKVKELTFVLENVWKTIPPEMEKNHPDTAARIILQTLLTYRSYTPRETIHPPLQFLITASVMYLIKIVMFDYKLDQNLILDYMKGNKKKEDETVVEVIQTLKTEAKDVSVKLLTYLKAHDFF